MQEAARKQRNHDKIAELWPVFGVKIAAVIADLEGSGFRPRIQDAWRSPSDQMHAYNTGHSKLKYGFHNVTGAGGKPEALAVDLLDDDHPADEGTQYLLLLASAAHAHGLGTGTLWGLTDRQRQIVQTAIANKDWHADVRVGWDPTHIEPVGITPAQAKAGQRP